MGIRKYTDWKGWWADLGAASLKAGATQASLTLSTLMGTNAVAHMEIPGLADVGMGWKTALGQLVIGFLLHAGKAAFDFWQARPRPNVVEETFETSSIAKDGTQIDTSVTVTPPPAPTP